MNIGIFIPGRLESERLPNKLVLPFGDSCLWDIACKKLSQLSKDYDTYALCSDAKLIEIAAKYPEITIIKRDPKTSRVDGPLQYIFKDILQVPHTHMMFLNPCLAFLSCDTINKSLKSFQKNKMEYATSVKPLRNWLFKPDGSSINRIDYTSLSTKEIPPVYQAAHCFHIFNLKEFSEDGKMLKPKHGILEVPEEETIDVDSRLDYEFAKWLYDQKIGPKKN